MNKIDEIYTKDSAFSFVVVHSMLTYRIENSMHDSESEVQPRRILTPRVNDGIFVLAIQKLFILHRHDLAGKVCSIMNDCHFFLVKYHCRAKRENKNRLQNLILV